MKHFRSPRKLLAEIDADQASRIIAASADIALILDRKGVIRDVACGSDDQTAEICGAWLGRTFADTVTIESKVKVEQLLKDASSAAESRWRQVNHPMDQAADLPVRYSAFQVGSEGRVVAIGRDLRMLASLQQRLVASQAQVEREYDRIRNLETRYRTLFQMSGEAMLIVDTTNIKVIEVNPAAQRLLANGSKRVIGRSLPDLFDEREHGGLQELLAAARASPTAREGRIKLASGERDYPVSVSLHRQGEDSHFLVRILTQKAMGNASVESGVQSSVMQVIDKLPDGFVLIDESRRIVSANACFIGLAQLAAETQLKGEPIDRWLGRVGVDIDVLIANLRESGSIKRYQTVLRGEYGANTTVEVSGVHAGPYYGLTIHQAIAESPLPLASLRALPHPIEQLTELVGRAPMKEVVRQTTDIIERMCIEAALRLTGDNRASAAELLGLSRQSLYVKLRRYGLEEGPPGF